MELDGKEALRRNRIIRDLLTDLELRCPGERRHAANVAVYAVATAVEMQLTGPALLDVRYAAELHDVGKVSPEGPDRRHPDRAAERMAPFPFLGVAQEIVLQHHEWWNGYGYPSGSAGNRIALGSRIIAVAEAFDAMTLPWGWRESVAENVAVQELVGRAGSQFDPAVVRAFLRVQSVIQPVGL